MALLASEREPPVLPGVIRPSKPLPLIMTDPVATPDSSRGGRLKQALVAVAVMLVVGVLFYLIGLTQGREPIAELEERVAVAKSAQAAAEDRAMLNRALALTYRAAIDLEERNFGTANEHLESASHSLANLTESDASRSLRSQMVQANLEVADDLSAQRARVLAFATAIEALRTPGASE